MHCCHRYQTSVGHTTKKCHTTKPAGWLWLSWLALVGGKIVRWVARAYVCVCADTLMCVCMRPCVCVVVVEVAVAIISQTTSPHNPSKHPPKLVSENLQNWSVKKSEKSSEISVETLKIGP